jgi:hypothetical protein
MEAYEQAMNIGQEFLGEDNAAVKMARDAYSELSAFPAESPKQRPDSGHYLQPTSTQVKDSDQRQPSLIIGSDSSHSVHLQTPVIPRLADIPIKETRRPDSTEEYRYYSQKQLERRQTIMDSSGNKFVSADQYFYKKLSKRFNIENDVKYLKPLTKTKDIRNVWEKEKEERKILNDLRMKRHQMKKEQDVHGAELVEKRIEMLKLEHEAMVKRESVKLLSKSKNLKRNTLASLPTARSLLLLPAVAPTTDKTDNKKNFQIAKEEIEELMDGIKDELKGMDTQRHARLPSWMGNSMKSESALALSAKRLPSTRE